LLGGHAVALLLELVALGNVLVHCDPAAPRHRSPGDADHAPIGELVDALGDFCAGQRAQVGELLLDRGVGLLRVNGRCVQGTQPPSRRNLPP
jgi:hypothetical protein